MFVDEVRALIKNFTEAALSPMSEPVITFRPVQLLSILAFALLLCTSSAFAQSGAGSIQGTVTDPSGAVIPKASVHIENTATAETYNTVSNGVGFYSVPGLFAGNYSVTFSAPGMKKYQAKVDLQVAQTLVLSPKLSIGASTEKVTVKGNAIQLTTYDSGTLSTQLDNARINQLPMNGRNLLTLTSEVTPGLNGTRADGLMPAGINFVQDGAQVNNRDMGGPANQVDPDAVRAVKIDMSSSNAMYSAPATAVITTKSGTNHFHGDLFETARNNAIGIARSRQNPSTFKAPHLVRNEFGASLGGPIIIPGLYNGKGKSFFFFAYERYSIRSGSYGLSRVPTKAMRQGDFSGLVNGNGILQTIYDPATTNPVTYEREPFPNNTIPISRISPLAKTLYAITPLPTNDANPLVQPNITYSAENNSTAPTITFRLDHTFNQNNRAYLRYTSYNSVSVGPYGSHLEPESVAGAGLPAGVSNLIENRTSQYDAALGFTHVFSPTFVSQTVIANNWMSNWINIPPVGANTNYEKQLGVPNNFGTTGFPNIYGPLYNFSATQLEWGGPQLITDIDENLTKTLGRNQLFFGGHYHHERIGIVPDRTPDIIQFGSLGTANYDPSTGQSFGPYPNTGASEADFFLGNAQSYSLRLNAPYEHWHKQVIAAYLQDDWHLNENLTLNLGLRWEADPAAVERHNLINGFDMKNAAIVLGEPIPTLIKLGYTTQAIITNLENIGVKFENTAQAGLPQHMVYGNNAIFDPRLGVAYAPFGSGHGTVFRAGFGQYSYPIPLRNFYASAKANMPFAGVYTRSFTSGAQSPDGMNNYILRSPQTVIAGQNSSNVVDTTSTTAIRRGIGQFFLNPNYKPNLVDEANFTIQQPMKLHSVLSVSYVWNHARNLDQFYWFNQRVSNYVWEVKTGTAPPGGEYSSVALNPYNNTTYGGLIRDDRNGYSHYNALHVEFQRQYQHGYGFQIYWVYAKGIRVGGNTFRDSYIYPAADYAPGMAPSTTYDGLNRFQNYRIDTSVPQHQIDFNGIVDLPIGRGKMFLGHVNRFLNEIVGGYQVAFSGNIVSSYFQPSSGNWGGINPMGTGTLGKIHIYKHKYKINDCNGGVCHKGYLWFNGFISPLLYNNPCGGNQISGLPGDYQPYQTPINMDPGTVSCVNGKAQVSNTNYLTNNVQVPLNNGTTSNVGYAPGPGLNPFSRTYLHGPFNWTADISLFKVFPITRSVRLRVNVDAFNAFNVQGTNNPSGSTGIQEFLTSHNTPRQIQLTARLTF